MAGKNESVRIHLVGFDSPQAFLDGLSEEGKGIGRLSVATKARFAAGEVVVLEIAFAGLPNRVLLRAHAVEPAAGRQVFDILTEEEHNLDFLMAVASGKAQASWQRRNRRIPMRLPATLGAEDAQQGSDRAPAQTQDLTAKGVFLKTEVDVPEGARVTVVLDPLDGSGEMEFVGTVVYTDAQHDKEGIGVKFDRLNSDEMKRLRRLIRDVKVRGKLLETEDRAEGAPARDPVSPGRGGSSEDAT